MADGETRGQGLGARGQGEDIQEVLYIGFGRFLDGVPARDLTADEWAALPEAARALAVALDLYQVVRAETEGEQDGREDAGVVDDDSPGAAHGGSGSGGVRRHRRGQTQG